MQNPQNLHSTPLSDFEIGQSHKRTVPACCFLLQVRVTSIILALSSDLDDGRILAFPSFELVHQFLLNQAHGYTPRRSSPKTTDSPHPL
jgi:hypothetical protein